MSQQSYQKQTVQSSPIEIISDLNKKQDKKTNIVKYTFAKQSEGTSEIFKKMRKAIATTPKEKK